MPSVRINGVKTGCIAIGGGGDSPIHYKNYAKFNGSGLALPFSVNADYKITVEFQETEKRNAHIIGNSYTGGRSCLSESDKFYAATSGSSNSIAPIADWTGNVDHIFITNNGNNKNIFDGEEVSNYTPGNASYTLRVGCGGGTAVTSNAWYGYLKRYKIESISNGSKICELLPCLFDNVTPCLYDTVGKKFYYPEGLTVMDTIPTT